MLWYITHYIVGRGGKVWKNRVSGSPLPKAPPKYGEPGKTPLRAAASRGGAHCGGAVAFGRRGLASIPADAGADAFARRGWLRRGAGRACVAALPRFAARAAGGRRLRHFGKLYRSSVGRHGADNMRHRRGAAERVAYTRPIPRAGNVCSRRLRRRF